jgi:hypothetical protein
VDYTVVAGDCIVAAQGCRCATLAKDVVCENFVECADIGTSSWSTTIRFRWNEILFIGALDREATHGFINHVKHGMKQDDDP